MPECPSSDWNRRTVWPDRFIMYAARLFVHTRNWSVEFGRGSRDTIPISRVTGAPGTLPGLRRHGYQSAADRPTPAATYLQVMVHSEERTSHCFTVPSAEAVRMWCALLGTKMPSLTNDV